MANPGDHQLPAEFLRRLQRIVQAAWLPQVLDSFSVPKKTSFRLNPLTADPDTTLQQLRVAGVVPHPVDWYPHAFWVEPDQRPILTHGEAAVQGQLYVQGLSSVLATLILDPRPHQWNLDLAAAPGGKATHMVALMNNQGKLSVVEPIRKRMFRLAENLNRMGSRISKTYLMDGRQAGRKVPNRFDCVMLDAPCSGESRIRIDQPQTHQFWSLRKIREQSRKQTGLILSGFDTLKPGGTLLYGTCSFAPEENEAIVSYLLAKRTDHAEVLPIEMPMDHWQPGLSEFAGSSFHPSVVNTRRVLPNARFDGFYLARIRKRLD